MHTNPTDIKKSCKQLMEALDAYSDCSECGKVIKDPSLLVPDPYNPGKFRSFCPSCEKETMRSPFPSKEFKPVFEMIAECAELSRPILVLVLACTAYEAMFDEFIYRLLERQHTPPDICDSVIDSMEYRSKLKIVRSLTGKSTKNLGKLLGFDKFSQTLEEIKRKRNAFIHTGIAKKVKKVKIAEMSIPRSVSLDDDDMKQAIRFTIDALHFFAELYTKFGKYAEIEPYDYW